MEIIQLSGYTEQEKYEIAKRHLLPKQMKINSLETNQLKISATATYLVIRNYTRKPVCANWNANSPNCAARWF